MATIAVMIAGAVLNATAFVGGSYLAKSLSSNGSHSDEEKIRHDKALEKYQHDMGEFEKKRQQYQDWLQSQYEKKKLADSNLNDTDYAFKLYSKAHPDLSFDNKQPQFSNYYKPSNKQKQYEMIYVGGGMMTVGYLASKFL